MRKFKTAKGRSPFWEGGRSFDWAQDDRLSQSNAKDQNDRVKMKKDWSLKRQAKCIIIIFEPRTTLKEFFC